ncbi:hypothetical protein MTR67_024279 [Solanum verrucosum]|uniref:Gag-pol polyprotein n=1 Tax=Solanum verrucosum TaxID=315347 RepID=A0AAF0TSV4_SOLVR|nr:hypothetical protein MTR67_024279 [Solanum verrucosum]
MYWAFKIRFRVRAHLVEHFEYELGVSWSCGELIGCSVAHMVRTRTYASGDQEPIHELASGSTIRGLLVGMAQVGTLYVTSDASQTRVGGQTPDPMVAPDSQTPRTQSAAAVASRLDSMELPGNASHLANRPSMTVDEQKMFESERERKRADFEGLQQNNMSVAKYEGKFHALARHASMILPTEAERVRRPIHAAIPTSEAGYARHSSLSLVHTSQVSSSRPIGSGGPDMEAYIRVLRLRLSGLLNFQLGEVYRVTEMVLIPFLIQVEVFLFLVKVVVILTVMIFPGRLEAEASDAVITGIILICHRPAIVLFDSSSTYSYVSTYFASSLDILCESLDLPVHVSTPVGDSVVVDRMYRLCIVTLMGYNTHADLKVLNMVDFDVILGMDWLSLYHAILNCHAKTIALAMPRIPIVEWRGSLSHPPKGVISFLKARHLVKRGCLAYLAHIRDTSVETSMLESISVVSKFSEVFSTDLPSLPHGRDIDFCIDIEPDTQPISIPPYRMTPAELKELKKQLQNSLNKGFIRPSVSPWGATVLFVTKKDGSMCMCIDYR